VIADHADSARTGARLPPWRLFLCSQCLSSIGTWTTRIAVAWLLYRLTQSVFWLGLAAFSGQIAVLLFSPLAAAVLDRCSRRRMLLLVQALFCVQASVLFLLAAVDEATAEWIVCLGALRGVVAAFDYPAKQAYLSELAAGSDDLRQAIAFDGMQVNVARVAGPMLAGFLIASFGESSCFLFDAVSYLIALAGLGLVGDVAVVGANRKAVRCGAESCWKWLRTQRPLCCALSLLGATSSLCLPFTVVLPQYVRDVLAGGPSVLGALVALSGVGAIAAAAVLWLLVRLHISDRPLRWSGGAAGICLAGLGMVDTPVPASVIVAALGFFVMLQVSVSAAFIQDVAPPNMRGRLAVVYSASFWGIAPFGSLLAGTAGHWLGPSQAFVATGLACAVVALVVFSVSESGAVRTGTSGGGVDCAAIFQKVTANEDKGL
jgi:MFS family permease